MARSSAPVAGFRPALPARRLLRALAAEAVGPRRRGLVSHFERTFAGYLGTPEAVALSSVRLGLLHSLEALALPPGSSILCTPLTVYPVIEAVQRAGYGVRFVDVESGSFCMDIDAAETALRPDVGALLVTHLWGVPGNVAALAEFAYGHDLALIEDASQCLGGDVGGRKVGTFGRVGLFSLGLTKTVTALSGAVLVTGDRTLSAGLRATVRDLPALGRGSLAREVAIATALRALTSPPLHRRGGAKVMDRLRRDGPAREAPGGASGDPMAGARHGFGDLQADLALESLGRFDVEHRLRARIAARYRAELAGLPDLRMAQEHADRREAHWAFAIFHPRAAALQARLRGDGIDAVPSSVDACHELPGAPELHATLPTASRLQRECTCLPLHGGMGQRDVEHVIRAVRAFCGGR